MSLDKKFFNNADLGLTVQKLICDKFNIIPNKKAQLQFKAAYNDYLASELDLNKNIDKIFIRKFCLKILLTFKTI